MSRLFTNSALSTSFGLLFLRIALAGSLLTHGIAKIENFSALSKDALSKSKDNALIV